MFGVALSIELRDFKNLAKNPKAAFIGVFSQFILLPALTFVLVILIQPHPSLALGMILVAACPGGNISNFITFLAKGNTALSVSLTAFSSIAAIIITPLNLEFWASLYSPTANILTSVNLNATEVFKTISLIIGAPLFLGMLIRNRRRELAKKISAILKPVSILIFLAFIVIAFANNIHIFMSYIHIVVLLVFLHNIIALSSGYLSGKVFGLSRTDNRTLAIETGIQNSGLGLLLIFTFFDGLGGMALVAAWWGIWHIISGMLLATFWSYRSNYQTLTT